MTVGELIKKLQDADQDARVVVTNDAIGVVDLEGAQVLTEDEIFHQGVNEDYPMIDEGDVLLYFE